jgi:hypothetical protein
MHFVSSYNLAVFHIDFCWLADCKLPPSKSQHDLWICLKKKLYSLNSNRIECFGINRFSACEVVLEKFFFSFFIFRLDCRLSLFGKLFETPHLPSCRISIQLVRLQRIIPNLKVFWSKLYNNYRLVCTDNTGISQLGARWLQCISTAQTFEEIYTIYKLCCVQF